MNRQPSLRILVVDDDPVSRAILQDYLDASGHDIFCAESAADAMYALENGPPVHLVLADWVMPDVTGLDLCRWVRGRALANSPHFVILTAHSDKDRLVEAFGAGADDFLSKPFDQGELLARLRAWSRLVWLQGELAERHAESQRLASELIAANRRLADLATRDELTSLGNRREALRRLDEQLAVAGRYDQPVTCALVDVDHFKDINDAHGHPAGDSALRYIADVLRNTTRAADGCFRMGGDEFLVLFPQQSVEGADDWARRLHAALATSPATHQGRPVPVSVSVGLAGRRPGQATTAEGLLSAADGALYAAKRAGRNLTRRSA